MKICFQCSEEPYHVMASESFWYKMQQLSLAWSELVVTLITVTLGHTLEPSCEKCDECGHYLLEEEI